MAAWRFLRQLPQRSGDRYVRSPNDRQRRSLQGVRAGILRENLSVCRFRGPGAAPAVGKPARQRVHSLSQ